MEIKSTRDVANSRLTCVIYGKPGIGKTTLAGTIKEKTLIISAESGLMSLHGTDIDVVEVSSWGQINEVVSYLLEDKTKDKYKWLFIDSLTELGQMLVTALKAKYPEKKEAMNLWGEYSDTLTRFVKMMREFRPYNVVLTALEKTDLDDMKRRITKVDLQGQIGTRIPAFFDLVLHMDLIEDEKGNTHRALLCESSDSVIAKDRSGLLGRPYEKPCLDTVYNKIFGVKK